MVQDEEDDVIHMGHAIMTFYSALIDLLGRCAPEMHVSQLSMPPPPPPPHPRPLDALLFYKPPDESHLNPVNSPIG